MYKYRSQVHILRKLKACLCFFPPHFQLQKAEANETDEADEEPTVVLAAQVFAPKSLVLVSRLDHNEVFKVHCSTLPIINHSSCIIKRISVYI